MHRPKKSHLPPSLFSSIFFDASMAMIVFDAHTLLPIEANSAALELFNLDHQSELTLLNQPPLSDQFDWSFALSETLKHHWHQHTWQLNTSKGHSWVSTQCQLLDDDFHGYALVTFVDISVYQKKQQQTDEKAAQLTERIKEMRCLYQLLELAQHSDENIEGFVAQAVALLPPAMQYPSATQAFIKFDDNTSWAGVSGLAQSSLSTEIRLDGKKRGHITVGYLGAFKTLDEGPFLKEERQLLNAFAAELSQNLLAKLAEQELSMLAKVFESSYPGIMICDSHNKILRVNEAFSQITGYDTHTVIGRSPSLLQSGRHDRQFYETLWQSLKTHDFWRGEIWNRRKNGEVYAQMLSISVIRNQHKQIQFYIGVFSDISLIKANEAELMHLANYDALTGLANRRLFLQKLHQTLHRSHINHSELALCFIDLDGFKPINDRLGHHAGDQVLIEVAHRLKTHTRHEDTLARLGGDEFVILFNRFDQRMTLERILHRILHTLEQPISLEGLEHSSASVSASIGVVVAQENNVQAQQLLAQADQAMYQAKLAGKNQIYFHKP